ncbi:MAG: dTDP-4-dehydrorhamnose 3,5-epimerase family protein, partial [Candidatus Eremiobacteraeota bacterium]|nr:dTDP-4-dehydrorhamnose 3,5-epimerase family protein [Candidatus Eremiobacteraeota bacterium]
RGSAFDVIVDLRPESATFLRWHGSTLSATGGAQLYIPRGFLHGFLALEDETMVAYKQTAPYDPAAEFSIAWNDPELAIEWPLPAAPILSERDAASPTLRAAGVTNGTAAR